jgi:hypothetical protein
VPPVARREVGSAACASYTGRMRVPEAGAWGLAPRSRGVRCLATMDFVAEDGMTGTDPFRPARSSVDPIVINILVKILNDKEDAERVCNKAIKKRAARPDTVRPLGGSSADLFPGVVCHPGVAGHERWWLGCCELLDPRV